MQENMASDGVRAKGRTAIGLFIGLFLAVSGCVFGPPAGNENQNNNGNTNTNTNNNDNASGRVVGVQTNFGISLLSPPIAVVYEVTTDPDNIASFYVPVSGPEQNAPSIGDRIFTETDLPAGTNQAFDFDPSAAGVGFFKVGLLITDGGVDEVVESRGVIQVQGPPAPFFIQPSAPVTTFQQGDTVTISIDAGDPQGIVQWRVYLLRPSDSRSDPPHVRGVTLATGSGNLGTFSLPTNEFIPGDYELGIAATDAGQSVSAVGEAGNFDLIVVYPSNSEAGPIIRITL